MFVLWVFLKTIIIFPKIIFKIFEDQESPNNKDQRNIPALIISEKLQVFIQDQVVQHHGNFKVVCLWEFK